MITRDLVAPNVGNLGRALDLEGIDSRWKTTGSAARVPSGNAAPTLRSSAPTIDLSGVGRRVRLVVLVGLGGMLLSCLLGLVAFVPAVIGAFEKDSPVDVPSIDVPNIEVPSIGDEPAAPGASPGPVADAPSLHTAAGWTQLVDAIKAESGSAQVYDLVAYPTYASVGLDGDGAVERRFYRDGAWQDSVSMRMQATGTLVDLAEIDPELIARLPGETAQAVGVDEPTGTYVIVNGFGGEPRIMVYIQSDVESRYRAYRLDGRPMS